MSSIKDVAKEAGVAISTVSKVLNNYPNISKDTKDKVNKAIDKLGFVPNAVAAALSSKQTGRIAILMNPSMNLSLDEIDMHYLSGAISQAREMHLEVFTLFFSMFADKSVEEITTFLKAQGIEGLIIFGLSKDDDILIKLVEQECIKTVLVDAPIVNACTSCVWIDQYKAQYDVVKELHRMNKPKTALYLSGKANSFVTEDRERAVTDFCKKKKMKLRIEPAEFSEKLAREIVLSHGEDYDCVICSCDICAIGAMRALMELDIFRPVCGFDGISLMGYAGHQMLTVSQDFTNIAKTAVVELHRLLSGESGRENVLAHKLERIEYLDVIQ